MPAKTIARPKQKSKKGKTQKRVSPRLNTTAITLTGILLLLAAIITIVWYNHQKNLTTTQQKIETYLEQKYKRKFVVGTPERKASGFGVEGYEESVVYPKGDEGLKFTAATSSTGSSDTYIITLWRRDEAPRLEAKLAEVYGYIPEYELSITANTKDMKNLSNVPPTGFNEAQSLYPNTLLYSLEIKSDVISIDNATKNDVSKKIYQMMQYISTKSLGSWSVSYFGSRDDSRSYGISVSSDDYKKGVTVEQLQDKFRFIIER